MVTKKLIIEVLFDDFIDEEWRICIFIKTEFDIFYVIMKGIPIITNFKRSIYWTFNYWLLAILAKLVVILKLGLRSISKRIASLIILNICHPPQHALTDIFFFYFKMIDKANSKFDLKIKEALHVNCRKSKLNAQRNDLALTLSLLLMSPPPAYSFLFLFGLVLFLFLFFCVSLSSII